MWKTHLVGHPKLDIIFEKQDVKQVIFQLINQISG